jgi:hypothetical protein
VRAAGSRSTPSWPLPDPRSFVYEREWAEAKAEEGGDLARQVGFDASALAIRSDGPIAAALIDYINSNGLGLSSCGPAG